jgi:hypothetical protein
MRPYGAALPAGVATLCGIGEWGLGMELLGRLTAAAKVAVAPVGA